MHELQPQLIYNPLSNPSTEVRPLFDENGRTVFAHPRIGVFTEMEPGKWNLQLGDSLLGQTVTVTVEDEPSSSRKIRRRSATATYKPNEPREPLTYYFSKFGSLYISVKDEHDKVMEFITFRFH